MPVLPSRLLLALLCAWLCAAPALAQVGSLFTAPSARSAASDIDTILERAAERGVGVIVIDSDGTVVSPANLLDAEAPAAAAPSGGMSLMKAQEQAVAFREALIGRLASLPVAIEELAALLRSKSPDGTIFAFVEVLLFSLVLFGIGMVAERQIFGKRIARNFITSRIRENPQGYSEKMPFLVVRFFGGIVGVFFSMAVAYVIGFIVFGPIEDSAIQYTATLVNIGYFSTRVIVGLWRMILSPYLEQYRIPALSDRAARKLHLWLCTVVIAGMVSMLLGTWIRELGLNRDVYVFMAALTSFVVLLLNFALVLFNYRAISSAILHGQEAVRASWLVRMLASGWVPLALLYLCYAWGDLVYRLVLELPMGVPLGAAAYLILTVVIVAYGVMNFFIERSFARARALRSLNDAAADEARAGQSAEPLPEAVQEAMAMQRRQMNTFEELAQRVAGILAFVAGLWAFLTLWSPDMVSMEESFAARTIDVTVILFLGYIAYNAFRIWVDNKIRDEQGDDEPAELGDEGGGSSASRLATLLPLFRSFVLIVIVVTVLLIALMEMGVNVGPLFAGAGIVGVAVGFGSQTLVRDIFSGAFFLFDDAFRKGEYIETGEVKGTVEKISVRSFQLRHHLGKLHTIPFGEIQVLTNYSRDWVMMKLPLRVTYDTDVEKVRKLIKKLGQDLLEDPEIGPDFLQPLKSQGVIEMQDSAMIIRVKFMTKPGDQWVIRKRVFQEIRDLFEQEGIRFAHREVTVRLADGERAETLSPQRKEAVLAAAEAALEDDLDMLPDGPGDDR